MRTILPKEKFNTLHVIDVETDRFEPVGEWKTLKTTTTVIVKTAPDEKLDYERLLHVFPDSPAKLYALVKEGFDQYYSDEWYGEEGAKDVIESFKVAPDEYRPNPSAKFKKDGLAPFFEISTIEVDLKSCKLVISGRVEEDDNLCEHGVSILIDNGSVKFGYALDHAEEEEF